MDGSPIAYNVHYVAWDPISAEKGEYRHFMQKEIHEQGRSLMDTIRGAQILKREKFGYRN
jgi:glucosamine--fructose-6-phosphate aminotransferase (isomerizing)